MTDLTTNLSSLERNTLADTTLSTPAVILMKNEINQLRRNLGLPDANFGASPEEVISKIQSSKAIDGSAGNGANIGSTYTNQIVIGALNGGAFRASGVNIAERNSRVFDLNGATVSSGYTPNTYGTEYTIDNISGTVTGDIITTVSNKLNLSAREELISGSTEGSAIITGLMQLAQLQKLVKEDAVCAAALTTSGTGLNPLLVNAQAPVHFAMSKIIGRSGQKRANGQKGKFYMNHDTFAKFLTAVDANGKFQEIPHQFVYANRDTMSEGADFKIGNFGGYDVILVSSDATSGFLSTYAVNSAGTITAQTGGNFTALGFGVPVAMTLAKTVGDPNMDRINVYSGASRDQVSDLNGRIQVLGTVALAAGLSIPNYFDYFALQL